MTATRNKHHEVLGVSITATQEEIKTAYRRAAMKHHPDRNGSLDAFQEVQKAYKALVNQVCQTCLGKGHVKVRNGAFTATTLCPKCWNTK